FQAASSGLSGLGPSIADIALSLPLSEGGKFASSQPRVSARKASSGSVRVSGSARLPNDPLQICLIRTCGTEEARSSRGESPVCGGFAGAECSYIVPPPPRGHDAARRSAMTLGLERGTRDALPPSCRADRAERGADRYDRLRHRAAGSARAGGA